MYEKLLQLLAWLKIIERQVEELKVNQPMNPVEEFSTKPPSRIPEWAEAIKEQEGWHDTSRSMRNLNPGNLKFSELIKEFGAVRADKDNFAIFPNYQVGFHALCDFLELACKDQLKSYHHARTLRAFTKVYALPPNDSYVLGVAGRLGVSPDINIAELL